MKMLYAPSQRIPNDALHNNVICGYEMQVIETLAQAQKNTQILYLPHKNTSEVFNEVILEHLKDLPIVRINTLKEGLSADCLVSDMSNYVFAWAFETQKPSIAHLSGFVKIEFSEEPFYKLLDAITTISYSLADLEHHILNLPEIKKERLEEFLCKEWM